MTINLNTLIFAASLLWVPFASAADATRDGVASVAELFGYEMGEKIEGAPDGVVEWGRYYTGMRNPPGPFYPVGAYYTPVVGIYAVSASIFLSHADESGVKQKEQVDLLSLQLEAKYGKPSMTSVNVPYDPDLALSDDAGWYCEVEDPHSFVLYEWRADEHHGLHPNPHYADGVSVITLEARGCHVNLKYTFANADDRMRGILDGVASGAELFGYEMGQHVEGTLDGVDEGGRYYTNVENPPHPFDKVMAHYTPVVGVCAVSGLFAVDGADELGRKQVEMLARRLEAQYGNRAATSVNAPYDPDLAPSDDDGEVEEPQSFVYEWRVGEHHDPHYADGVRTIALEAKDELVKLQYTFANADACDDYAIKTRYFDERRACLVSGLVSSDFGTGLEQQEGFGTLFYRWAGSENTAPVHNDRYCGDYPESVGSISVGIPHRGDIELQGVSARLCTEAAITGLRGYWVYSDLGEAACESAPSHAWSTAGACLVEVPTFLRQYETPHGGDEIGRVPNCVEGRSGRHRSLGFENVAVEHAYHTAFPVGHRDGWRRSARTSTYGREWATGIQLAFDRDDLPTEQEEQIIFQIVEEEEFGFEVWDYVDVTIWDFDWLYWRFNDEAESVCEKLRGALPSLGQKVTSTPWLGSTRCRPSTGIVVWTTGS